MKFKYVDDVVKHEYEVVFLDKNDYKMTTYVPAYSAKQAEFYVKKNRPNCYEILQVNELEEIPDKNGKQIEMDFGE